MLVLYLVDSHVAVQLGTPEVEHLSCLRGHRTTNDTQRMTQDTQDRCRKAGDVTSASVSIQVGSEGTHDLLMSHQEENLSETFFFLLFTVLARGTCSATTSYI